MDKTPIYINLEHICYRNQKEFYISQENFISSLSTDENSISAKSELFLSVTLMWTFYVNTRLSLCLSLMPPQIIILVPKQSILFLSWFTNLKISFRYVKIIEWPPVFRFGYLQVTEVSSAIKTVISPEIWFLVVSVFAFSTGFVSQPSLRF